LNPAGLTGQFGSAAELLLQMIFAGISTVAEAFRTGVEAVMLLAVLLQPCQETMVITATPVSMNLFQPQSAVTRLIGA